MTATSSCCSSSFMYLFVFSLDLYQIYFETIPLDFRQYKSRTVLKLKTEPEKKVSTPPQPALPRCARPASVLSD